MKQEVSMKKSIVITCVIFAFLVSGFSIYSYMKEKNRYTGQTVVPEKRDDLPLYEGLEFQEHEYMLKGNHWYTVYEFYKEKLPENGWKLIHKQASLEASGGFIMSWEKDDKELWINGGWNTNENETEIIFDINPSLH